VRRYQRSRLKGARLPEGCIVVTKPTPWANPHPWKELGRVEAVRRFAEDLDEGGLSFTVQDVREHLAGHDLACYCPLDGPCHADVLLEVANR